LGASDETRSMQSHVADPSLDLLGCGLASADLDGGGLDHGALAWCRHCCSLVRLGIGPSQGAFLLLYVNHF
jgi:hypothetical protein